MKHNVIKQFHFSHRRRKKKGLEKWDMPEYIYPRETIPAYLAGPTYAMSRPAAECLNEGESKFIFSLFLTVPTVERQSFRVASLTVLALCSKYCECEILHSY